MKHALNETCTMFHLVRDRCGVKSEITRTLPGDCGSKAVLEFVRYDEWCRQLRDSGFEIDPATIYLVTPVARD